MLKQIAKTAAYMKAPRTTFVVSHPRTALKLKALKYQLRHSAAPRLAGLAAAAVALPVGLLVGRMIGRNGARADDE